MAVVGQTATPASKIVVVDSSAFFDEKTGITKIVTASKALAAELAGKRAEVQQLIQKVDMISKEIEAIRGNAGRGIPVDERTLQNKVEDLERLRREGKYKEDEFNAFAQKKQKEVVGPIYAEVMKALGEYIKVKEFGLVFDVAKDPGIIIYASDKFDITKEFIAYYNARPVTSISSVPVK